MTQHSSKNSDSTNSSTCSEFEKTAMVDGPFAFLHAMLMTRQQGHLGSRITVKECCPVYKIPILNAINSSIRSCSGIAVSLFPVLVTVGESLFPQNPTSQ